MSTQLFDDSNPIRKFLKFQKMHRCLPLTIQVPTTIESKPFQLTISRIMGLKRPQNPALNLQFSIVANFFVQNQNDRCFFGRTYLGPRINIDFGVDGVNYEHAPIQIYFHTRINANKESPLLVIIEVQAYESQQDLVLKRQHLGWTEIQALTITQVPAKLTLRKGSPRVILLNQQVQFEQSGFTLLAEVGQIPEFQICQHLIPENALCGMGDELPGLKQIFIGKDFELSRSTTVYMSSIQVLIPDNLEVEIYKQVQKYRTYKYRTPEDYKGDIQIVNKRLIAAYHNGWTFVNSRGTNNFVPLGETRMIVTENVEGKPIQFRQLVYQGVIDINNVCSTDPQGNSGMLIAQLEYESTFLITHTTRETISLILGWIPIYINNKFGQDDIMEDDFILGPGKTITGRQMMQFPQGDFIIKFKANLNLSGGGLQVQDIIQKPVQQQQQQQQYSQLQPQQSFGQSGLQQSNQFERMPTDQSKTRINMQDTDIRTQIKLKEIEQQVYRLQEENDRLRKTGQLNSQEVQKQQEYLRAIEQLREENRMLQFSQAKQFQGLERLIKDQQPTTHQMAPKLIESNPQNIQSKLIDSFAYPVQSANLRSLDRTAEGFMMMKALVELGDDVDNESRTLRIEEEDERKDQVIVIQATSFKQILGDYPVCKSVYLTLNFYDLPTFKTPHLKVEYCDDERNFKFNLESNNPLRLLHNQEPFNLKFVIESTRQRYQSLFINFCKYLYHRHLLIDVWDGETMFLYGTIRVPLRGLLRQGKQSSHMMNDVEISDGRKIKGNLQLLIRNIGKIGSNQQSSMNKTAPVMKSTNGLLKTKLISDKPVNREIVPVAKGLQKDESNRIQNRIDRIKQINLTQLPKNASKDAHTRTLHEVQKFKEMKKTSLLKTIVQGFLTNEYILHAFYGQCDVVSFPFKNTYPSSQQFNIVIEDPDSRYLEYSEFFIISNPGEWKFWTNLRGYPEPSTYSMIKVKDYQGKQQFYFNLDPSEEVTILFKAISFRSVDPQTYNQENFVSRDPDHMQKYISQRQISVYFQSIDGKMIDGLRVIVEPHQQIIDHILRFYQRENRQAKLNLPPIYSEAQNEKPLIHITDPSVLIEWNNNNNQIKLSLKVGQICSVKCFNVIAYADQYQCKIIGNWKIEVYSLSGFDIEVPLGQAVISQITLPCDITRIVKLQAENPNMIQFVKPYDKEITLMPGKVNLIPLSIRALKEGKQTQLINCVDVHAQDLIYSWLANINAIAQQPSAVYELKCMEGRESRHQITYKNQYNYVITFNMVSSTDKLIVLDPQLQVGPVETVNFKIRVLQGCEEDAKVFFNDVEERIFDTILLKIKYVY